MIWVSFYLVAGFFTIYVLSPFFERSFRNRKLASSAVAQENLMFRKQEILGALDDLEYDYKMKKMSASDYDQLKEKLTGEAIDVMKKLEQPGKSAAPHEAEQKRKARS